MQLHYDNIWLSLSLFYFSWAEVLKSICNGNLDMIFFFLINMGAFHPYNWIDRISTCNSKLMSSWMPVLCEAAAVRRSDVLAACYWGVYLSILWEMISPRPLSRRLVGQNEDGWPSLRKVTITACCFFLFFFLWSLPRVWEAVGSGFSFDGTTPVSPPVSMNRLPFCSCRLQVGKRGGNVQKRGWAAGGEDQAAEDGGSRWICHQKTGRFLFSEGVKQSCGNVAVIHFSLPADCSH